MLAHHLLNGMAIRQHRLHLLAALLLLIAAPATVAQTVDNEGNPVLSFGTWGNRDSMGGLKGDLVPTKDIPLGWPNSVDATDDHIYIGDIVNCRLLRIAKTFAVEATAP